MEAQYPSLKELISSPSARDKLVAFSSIGYGQAPVLFLCAVYDFQTSASPTPEEARGIYNEYLADKAPHPVAQLSQGCRKGIEKKLKSKKVDKNTFQAAWSELETSLEVLQAYEPEWKKEYAVDTARRSLLREIEFNLDQPPTLAELLESPQAVKQLRIFAESIYCEEIVLFYVAYSEYAQDPTAERGRDLCDRFVSNAGELSLNLEYDTRQVVLDAFAKGSLEPDVFQPCVQAIMHQMQQNLYYQFVSHLRAIKKELTAHDEFNALRLRVSQHDPDVSEEELRFVPPSFSEVIEDPIRLLELMSFAGRLYSQERLVFYILVDTFRHQPTDLLRCQMATRIYDEYIVENASRQVSLEGRRYKRIVDGYKKLCDASRDQLPHGIDLAFFDAAQKEVRRSLEHEIFPRFLAELEAKWNANLEEAKTAKQPGAGGPSGGGVMNKLRMSFGRRKNKE